MDGMYDMNILFGELCNICIAPLLLNDDEE